jgi:diguanylate cyclase (GGDEF)-like protein
VVLADRPSWDYLGMVTTQQDAASSSRIGRVWRTAWPICATAVLVAAYLACVWLRPGGEAGAIAGGGSIVTLAQLTAGFAGVRAGQRSTGTDRLGWYMLGAGLLSVAVGNAGWLWYTITSPTGPPFPAVTDIGFVAVVPLTLGGAAALGGLGRAGVRVLLDGLVISGSLLLISWVTVLGPLVQHGVPSLVYSVFVLAMPIGDVAMASMVFILLARVERHRRLTFALVACGMLGMAVADSSFAYMMQVGAYSSGNLAMLGWLLGCMLLAYGARNSRTDTAPARHTSDSPLWLALPYVPLAAALVTSVLLHIARGGTGTVAYVLGMMIVVLVIARQLVALRDNVQLTRSLRSTLNDLRRREEELEHMAFHDPLTGLANRALFHNRSSDAVHQLATTGSTAVLYIDLDGFKQVNDRLGHAAGDALLAAVADRLGKCVRPSDTVARLGGDEFAILLTGVDSIDTAKVVADRVVRVVDEEFFINEESVTVGASVGLAWNDSTESNDGEDLLRQADIAMYAAKTQGKRRYVCFEPPMRPAELTAV